MKALIIGGTKGFGKEISDNLINNGIGVITVSRSKIHYKDHLHYRCDLSNLMLWKRCINKILKENKDIELIFFVYGFAKPKNFINLNTNDWLKSFSTNVVYIALLLQKLEDKLQKKNIMKIVTIGSQWSYKIGCDYLVPYTISKHGLRTLTEGFAQRNKNIIINCICVPTMDTPGYYKIRKEFEKLGRKELIGMSKGLVADHKHIANEVVRLTLKNNESGATYIITSEGKIGKLKNHN
ncbi:SDR family oxidoreductase [Candidatus Woesearchaeota archaeon]|nr:SDR family oxidoreductase [Candidatus Woesearchaeota archaeon]